MAEEFAPCLRIEPEPSCHNLELGDEAEYLVKGEDLHQGERVDALP